VRNLCSLAASYATFFSALSRKASEFRKVEHRSPIARDATAEGHLDAADKTSLAVIE